MSVIAIIGIIAIVIRIETSDTQKINDLHFHLFVRADIAFYDIAFFFIDVWKFQVEVNGRGSQISAQVKNTIYLDRILVERGVWCQVFQRGRVDGIYGLKVHVSVFGQAAKGYASTGLEYKLLVYHVLQAEFVFSMIQCICSVKSEITFIEIAGLEVSSSPCHGIVARYGVKYYFYVGIGSNLQLGIDMNIGIFFYQAISLRYIFRIVYFVFPFGTWSLVDKRDESVIGNIVGTSHIIDEPGVCAGTDI